MTRPLLWLIIGPNGAGKSTYYDLKIKPRLRVPLVNADHIAAERWPGAEMSRAYDAARLAEARRRELLQDRRSMVAETVFSHPSKLAFVHDVLAAGYLVWVTFINLQSSDLSVARVACRVQRGGHDVPADKIRERHTRMVLLAVEATRLADRAFVVDNSSARQPFRDVLALERGRVTWSAADPPVWASDLYGLHASG